MSEIGVFLSSEEHGPNALVQFAQQAEAAGFRSVWISDHYHPWSDRQGQSPFVWSVIGGIAATTELTVTTAVTCPTFRIHPAVMAQAAATAAVMLPGRFRFGIGSGENLNEHILGEPWPPAPIRLKMLEEAVDLMRRLWTGEPITHRGTYYKVDTARIYTLPEEPPPVLLSAFGPKATELAARIADGFVSTKPDAEMVELYESNGGKGPKSAGLKVCWGKDEAACRKLAHEVWCQAAVPGQLNQELPSPEHFEEACENVTEDMVAEKITCGPDPERHAEAVRQYVEAGFDDVHVQQIGTEQKSFFNFYQNEVLPRL